MIKINYPDDIKNFKDEYYSLISKKFDIVSINTSIEKISVDWNLEKLLIASFLELMSFSEIFKNHKIDKDKENILKAFIKNYDDVEIYNSLVKEEKKKKKKPEKEYFYTDLRNDIVSFLKERKVNIKSCLYCNIEYINNFEEIFTFKDENEFLNDAPDVHLKNSDLSEKIIKKIRERRKEGYLTINDFQFGSTQKKRVKDYCLNNKNKILKVHNEHFALDHVISKAEQPYLSLSIFNLVPCCSSCNSKFKHTKEFKIEASLPKIIPSSEQYKLNELIEFRLKDAENYINKKNKDDLIVELTNLNNSKIIDQYFSIFKLKGRYEEHKEKAFDIIKKRQKYTDTQINEMSKLLGISSNQIKKDIFGKECFESANEPFEKYKQDIAKQIKLHLLPDDTSK